MRNLLLFLLAITLTATACSGTQADQAIEPVRGWNGEVVNESREGRNDELTSPRSETEDSLPFADPSTKDPSSTIAAPAVEGWINPEFIFAVQVGDRTEYTPERVFAMDTDIPPEACVGPLDVQEIARAEPIQAQWTALRASGERVRVSAASIGSDRGALGSKIYRVALTCRADDLHFFEVVTRDIPNTGPIEVYTMQDSETSGALWGTTFHRNNISVIVVVASKSNDIDGALFDQVVSDSARALDEAPYEQRIHAFNLR